MQRRIVLDGDGWQYHHVLSRIVDRRIIFGNAEKREFRLWLGRYAEFCGMRILTYCLMGNHFHVLVGFSVGEAKAFAATATDAELVQRARAIYPPETVAAIARALGACRKNADAEGAERIRRPLLSRMGDLSVFVKEFKLRFSRWYNARNDRVGTLWESRFRSVLVEGCRSALETVAAYIDLNPVRAKLAANPEDYRFCGYAEAVAGNKAEAGIARAGIATVVDLATEARRGESGWWSAAQKRYRLLLFGRGARSGIIDAERLAEVAAAGGKLSRSEVLRCRIRYFTEGGAIGTEPFLESVFRREKQRGRFGGKRESGAREMRGAEWGDLAALRDLRKSPVSASSS